MKRSCELCEGTARIHCEPDHASLCWDCDADVHSANFLVARHSRNLLCHVCQSPTPLSASGPKLGPTASVCHQCSREADGETAPEEMENKGIFWSPPPSSESSSITSSYESSDDEYDSSSSYFNIGAPESSYPAEEVARVKEWHSRRIEDRQRKIRRRDSGPVGLLNSGCCRNGFGSGL